MADRDHNRAERNEENADELLCTDFSDNSIAFGLDSQPLTLDHCDLLLDAMDAQLDQLQVQPQKREAISRQHDSRDTAPLRWSQSLSKDTGFGSTTQTNDTPMSCLDLIHTPTMEQTLENTMGCWDGSVTHEEIEKRRHRCLRDKEETESRREQVIWRLRRLLGDTCKEGVMAGETHLPSDSICTEDFASRFREEMVEMAVPDSSIQQLNKEEKAGGTEISDSDACQSGENGKSALKVEGRTEATNGENSKDTVTATYSQLNKPGQKKQQKKCVSDSYGLKILDVSEKKTRSPLKLADESSVAHITEVVTDHENMQHNNSCSPKARCLAGVPVLSFDTVSIDSDLDTVCTEQVRKHIHKRPGWHSLIQSVTDMNDPGTTQSDCDTLTQDESEPQPTSVQLSSSGQKKRHTVRKAQCNRRETFRHVCSLSDNDKDTDDDISHWSRTSRLERTSKKMQSDWTKMKERLSKLQQKCEKEEETLRLRRTQLKDAEFSLSELLQKKKHALQELERLTAETAQMEKDKRALESVLRDSRVERESVSCNLQRQKESCLLKVRDTEEDLATLSQCKQTLNDGSCMNRNNVLVSVLEREEMERQLDSAKTELFAEQRHAREKLESMQEKLEEGREELHRATEAESSLRNRCTVLEEKQMQKKEQIKAFEIEVSGLQDELEKYKIRVGTLEKMLAQKDLHLLDLQEQWGALQTERDGQKGELLHLKTQHDKALREAQDQAKIMMVKKQAEEEKTSALKEQTLSLTQHIESMQNSIQLKEEEVNKLRKSLQQQKEEAQKREEELHADALEKVHKAVEEERMKWEAEKLEAVQVHCGILEEQNRKELESLRSEIQREKSKAQALQHQVMELKTKMQQLESESCAQQREQDSLMAVICKKLKEEHQAELQRSQKHMVQQSQRTVLRLQQDVQLAVKEADRLQARLEERESSHQRITADMEQKHKHWAQQLGTECQHLHLLLEQSGTKESDLPTSQTVDEALKNLKMLQGQLRHFISHLHQELNSQKQTNEQLSKDKEQELNIQRQQLRVERDQALNSIKERLIQEHLEELSSMKWAQMIDGGAEAGGAAASLRKQLRAKDLELRKVQRSMAQWKEQTTARLACKFEEELTADLERKAPKAQEQQQRKPQRPGVEMIIGAKETQNPVCSPFLYAVDSAASHSPSDVASFKLLSYLQSRVKQLRVENQAYMWSPPPPYAIPSDLSGSYLTTITQDQQSAGLQSQSSIRMPSSERCEH